MNADPGDTLKEIIKIGESAAAKWLAARILTGMGIAAGAWYYGLVYAVVTIPVWFFIRYADVLGFMLVNEWQSTAKGESFLKAADRRRSLPKGASLEERNQTEMDLLNSFADLVDLGTSN